VVIIATICRDIDTISRFITGIFSTKITIVTIRRLSPGAISAHRIADIFRARVPILTQDNLLKNTLAGLGVTKILRTNIGIIARKVFPGTVSSRPITLIDGAQQTIITNFEVREDTISIVDVARILRTDVVIVTSLRRMSATNSRFTCIVRAGLSVRAISCDVDAAFTYDTAAQHTEVPCIAIRTLHIAFFIRITALRIL